MAGSGSRPAINTVGFVKCVTEREFSEKRSLSLAKFGTTVISEVKSNAILLVATTTSGFATVGVGPGQTSRVEAVRIAARRAGDRAKRTQ